MEEPQQGEPVRPGGLEAEIAVEQAAVDRAYERLAVMRESALDVVRHHRELGQTTSGQARVEWESLLALTDQRLHHLELGGASLCFGRLDRAEGETYQVGRLSILDEAGDPLVIDWRAPAAEAFYRATGRNPMGLVRRRHLLTRGRTVIGLDDEVFDLDRAADTNLEIVGEGALLAALERSRTGRMGDIVATIQAEQDVIIRAPFPGLLIVQGGPGTGKTAVALHRAAYLLYTNRQRLEDAGVLVVGPNRVFLRYIEHVLPSLGESGVELATIDGLYSRARATGSDTPLAERVKGDARMVDVLRKAVQDRERALARDLIVPYGARNLRVPRAELARIVEGVRARKDTHNARRPALTKRLRRALWRQQRRQIEQRLAKLPRDLPLDPDDELDPLDVVQAAALTLEREEEQFMGAIGAVAEVRAALERKWPVLTPEQLLHDLFGAPSLLRLATAGILSDEERDALARPRSATPEQVSWTSADLALLDEAHVLLGPPPRGTARRRRGAQVRESARWMIEETVDDIALQTGELDQTMRHQLITRLTDREGAVGQELDEDGSPPAYGHVIVDEAQDLSPMQWRMIARRNPAGSMTIVGDLGQSSRVGAIHAWDDALAQLPARREPRMAELTINYRTPSEIMDLAAAVLQVTDPGLEPPKSVRTSGARPRFTVVGADQLVAEVTDQVVRLHSELGDGKVAVIAPPARVAAVAAGLGSRPDLDFRTGSEALDASVALFTPTQAKGLEFDAVVLVEPTELAGGTVDGLRGLYVALTRATRFLAVVHTGELPEPLRHR
jgi:DNA helicase IV